jgi:hypothetical protein
LVRDIPAGDGKDVNLFYGVPHGKPTDGSEKKTLFIYATESADLYRYTATGGFCGFFSLNVLAEILINRSLIIS